MSVKLIYDGALEYSKQLANNEITEEAVKQKIRDVCFAEPKVPADAFLENVRSFDPKFAPVQEETEIQKRTELSQKAQEGILNLVMHDLDRSTDGLVLPEGKELHRAHKILILGLSPTEKQEMATLLLTDEQAAGQLIYDRLAPKKDQILSMLDLNDEDLVNNYFPLADEFSLIAELQTLRMICKFTPEQDQELQELYDNMDRFSLLERRIDMISNPYYAKYPIEGLQMSNDDSYAFNSVLGSLAKAYTETVGIQMEGQVNFLRGPTHMLGDDYFGMRSYSISAVEQQAAIYLKQFGKQPRDESILWADTSGKTTFMGFTGMTNDLFDRKPIFIHIPGVGAKAVYNTATNPLDCKLEDAPDEVLNQHMQKVSKNAIEQVGKANPFLLSVFSGSRQYNAMEKCMKEVEKARQALKYPLNPESVEVKNVIEAIKKLESAQAAYIKRKEGQGLERDGNNKLVGRTENEVIRLAAAKTAKDLVDTLKFQLGYQLDPESASERIVKNEKSRERRNVTVDKNLQNNKKPEKTTVVEKLNDLADDEKLKGTKEQMLANNVYDTMPPCKASDAGEMLESIRKDIVSVFGTLAGRANQNKNMDSLQNDMRKLMAQMVLFDCALRERVSLNDSNADPIQAGPIEKALSTNKGFGDAYRDLSSSQAFKDAIGKVTPARIEAFLNGKEARDPKFNQIVQEALGIAKPNVTVASNQPVQQQLQQTMSQSKPQVLGGP